MAVLKPNLSLKPEPSTAKRHHRDRLSRWCFSLLDIVLVGEDALVIGLAHSTDHAVHA